MKTNEALFLFSPPVSKTRAEINHLRWKERGCGSIRGQQSTDVSGGFSRSLSEAVMGNMLIRSLSA